MNENTIVRHSFSNGIVSPGIRNRTDWDKHDSSVADAVNFLIGPSGEMRKRPGSRFIDMAFDDADPDTGERYPVRLVEFEFALGQTYILEFGHEKMRFYMDGGAVLGSDGKPYELATPYTADQAQAFSFAQDRDAMYFAHWDRPLKSLTRYGHVNWKWDDVFKESGRVSSPEIVSFYTDATNGHTGHEYAVTAYTIEAGTYKESINFSTIPSKTDDIDSIGQVPQGNIDSCINWIKTYRARYGHLAGFPTYPAAFEGLSDIVEDAEPTGTLTLHPKLFAIYKLKYPNAVRGGRGTKKELHFPGGGQPPKNYYHFYWYLLDSSGNTVVEWDYGNISETADQDFHNFHVNDSAPVNGKVLGFYYTYFMRDQVIDWINTNQVSINGQTMSGIYNAIMSFIATYNQNHSQKIYNRIKWTGVTGATGYLVYRRTIGAEDKKFYQIADVRDALDFNDKNVEETEIGTRFPIERENSFVDPLRYPNLVTFYQQRMVLGCTKEKPTSIFGSHSGIYTNHDINPSDPASAYEFKMASTTSNQIKALLPLRTLYILTTGGAFVSTITGAMNASNVNFNQDAFLGAADIPPVIIDRTGVYVPLHRQSVNMLNYSFADDSFADENMLFACQNLTEDRTITSIAYQRAPCCLIWAALSDGTLLSCTYVPKQGFLAWTRHVTQGKVLSVCTYTNLRGFDEIYMVVERTRPDGTTFRAIEAIEDTRPFTGQPTAGNSFFVDCGLSGVRNPPEKEVTRLEHLEGMEVIVLADMNVQTPKTVVGGKIELDNPASVVHVGLPYEASLQTLDLEMRGVPTLRGTRRRIYKARVEVEKTRDLSYSLNGGDPHDVTFQTGANIGLPLDVRFGDIGISGKAENTNGTYLRLSSRHPLPCTVNSLVAEVKYAG